MKHLIVGMGEVGAAIYELLAINGKYDVQTIDKNPEAIKGDINVLHICFPPSDKFIKLVKQYAGRYEPDLIIIYSSVPVGTTAKIGNNVVHSPIEGKHPRLTYSTRVFTRWIGYNNYKYGKIAKDIWSPVCRKVKLVEGTEVTEFLKLASTSKYGLNIVWADYMNEVCKKLGMDYENVREWDQDYNDLYGRLSMKQYQKYILDPPTDKIGGHCIMPNAEILDEQFPSPLLKELRRFQ